MEQLVYNRSYACWAVVGIQRIGWREGIDFLIVGKCISVGIYQQRIGSAAHFITVQQAIPIGVGIDWVGILAKDFNEVIQTIYVRISVERISCVNKQFIKVGEVVTIGILIERVGGGKFQHIAESGSGLSGAPPEFCAATEKDALGHIGAVTREDCVPI